MFQILSKVYSLHKEALITTLAFASSAFRPINLSTLSFNQLTNGYLNESEEYDLAVIGGGSGGLATAFEASKYGLKTVVIDYVEESPGGSKWGLGGTCVNVGCIPKKLMHQGALIGGILRNAHDYGWEGKGEAEFKWEKLRRNIMNYVKSLNFSYVSNIHQSESLEYLNYMATFVDSSTLLCSTSPKVIENYVKTQTLPTEPNSYVLIKSKNFVIATGTRPHFLPIKGANLAITSDDIFMKKEQPGKTLIVGGGYVGVEIAGFLNGFGYPVCAMTRGEFLRGFDRDMVGEVIGKMKMNGVNVMAGYLPIKLEKTDNKIQVTIQNQTTNEISEEGFDTVLFAVGRKATTQYLNLSKIGIPTSLNSKVLTNPESPLETKIENIYAIGDVVEGLPELTSTATKMGAALGRRLAHKVKGIDFKQKKMSVDLKIVPVTVFGGLEYAVCGLGEEKAIEEYGRDNVEVFHIRYYPLEEEILNKSDEDGNSLKDSVYAKAIVNKTNDKVIGLHYAGPHAGEIMQGFAVAMKMGMTKELLDETIGIHPVSAENLTNMNVTKESGLPFEKTSC